MSGSALTRSHSSSSCAWSRGNFFVMVIMSLISSHVILVSCTTLPLVSSSSSSSDGGSNSAVAESLTADPHAGTQSDTPSHEKAATTEPVILSKGTPVGSKLELEEGRIAQLECVVRDLGDHAKIWKIGGAHLLFAGEQRGYKNPRINLIGEDRKLEIRDLTLNDTGEYICQVAARGSPEIKYDLRVIPRSTSHVNDRPSTSGHAKHPQAKNHSPSSLNPSSTSAVSYNTAVTGIALLSLFLNNYFVRQA